MAWIIYNEFQVLSEWLDNYKPSRITQMESPWLFVRNYKAPHVFMGNEKAALEEWNWIIGQRVPTAEDIDTLAKKHSILSGKWLIFAKSDQIDCHWNNIATATLAGSLGSGSKVSTRSDGSHVICVYTNNYLDEGEVKKVRQTLNEMGFKSTLNYKPDIYTHLNIYANNAWKLHACKYWI